MKLKPIRTKNLFFEHLKIIREFFSRIVFRIKLFFVYKYLTLKICSTASRGDNTVFTEIKAYTDLGQAITAILTKQNFTIKSNFFYELIISWTEDHV